MPQSVQYHRTCVASEIVLPLPPCSSGLGELSLSIGPNPFPHTIFHEEYYQLPDGTIQIAVAQDDEHFRIRFPNMAEFWIDAVAQNIVAQAKAEATSDTLAHLFIDQVMPRFLSTRGHTALHASGAVVAGQAALFVGQSGWGKSTLASEFHFSGHPGISDDVIFIEKTRRVFHAVPSYPGFRLWPHIANRYETSVKLAPVAHYYSKQRLITKADVHSASIGCGFLIVPPDEASDSIEIEPVDPMKAFWSLTEQSFRWMPSDRAQIQREFTLFSDLAETVPFFSLSYPRQLPLLPGVRQRIVDHVAGLG